MSEELIRKKLSENSIDAEVKYVKDKEYRKILVGNKDAFVQGRDDPRGRFVGDFEDLQLPP